MLPANDKKLLEKKRPELIGSIDILGSKVLAELRARGALTSQQEGVIRAQPGNENQVGHLLDTLLRGDAYTMDKFIYALRCSGHDGAVKDYLREPYREDAWDPEELKKVIARERKEMQQTLRHNIRGYIKNDPSRILEETESADYINQPILAYKMESGNSSEKIPPENVFQLLESCHSEGQRIFIYGAGGMGKSSLCRHIAQTWALGQSKLSKQFDYVLPMPMRAIRSHSLVDMICKDMKLIPASWKLRIEQELELRSVLFILDSFEELSYETPEINKLIRRELYPKSSVVITARPGHKLEEEEHESAPCIKADLQDLTEEQVKSYMANYPCLQRDVRLGIEQRFGMGFLRKPINLWLLCLLVAQTAVRADMPTTQTTLLNMIVQRLMLAYSKKKKLSDLNVPPESPYKRLKLSEVTSESPMKNAPTEVKVMLKEVGKLCYSGLRDKKRVLITDEDVLSKADVMAMGLFSEGADDNSVTLPHPLFQEYLAALFLSVDKQARQDLFKELTKESKGSFQRRPLVKLLRPRGFGNMVRFLVGLSPGVAEELSVLFYIEQLKLKLKLAFSVVYPHGLSYELALLKECSGEEGRSMIADGLLKAPVSLSVRDELSLSHNPDSHLLLHHYDEEQQGDFLRKFYGCQICNHELIRAPDRWHCWLDSFVIGVLYFQGCTVRLEKAWFKDCNVPVGMLTDRLAAVEELKVCDSMLCDLTEAQFLASLNLRSLPHPSTVLPLRHREVLLSSVQFIRVKGLNLLSQPHCKVPTTRKLMVWDCDGVNLGSLCQCFTGVSQLILSKNKRLRLENAGQWSSVRELRLGQCGSFDLISLKEIFVQLEELRVNHTNLKVENKHPDRQTPWNTVKNLRLRFSYLNKDEKLCREQEAREFLTLLCPKAEIHFEPYGPD